MIAGWYQQDGKPQWIFEDYQSANSFAAGANYQGVETAITGFDFELIEVKEVYNPLGLKK